MIEPDHIFHVDVYKLEIGFFWSFEKYIEYMLETFGEDVASRTIGARAYTSMYRDTDDIPYFFIVMSGDAPVPTYAHECLHMVDMVSKEIGMPLKWSTTEPRAYLLECIMRSLLKESPHITWDDHTGESE